MTQDQLLETKPVETKPEPTKKSNSSRPNWAKRVVIALGVLTISAAVAFALFGPEEVLQPADDGVEAEPESELELVFSSAAITDSLDVETPFVSSTVSNTAHYTAESLSPSTTFLRWSRSAGFSLDEAGWYMYSNANTIRDLVRVDNRIYAVSGAGLTVWDLDKGEANRLTSYDGLVGNDINQIVYCEWPEPKLIIATENGVGILDPDTLKNEIYNVAGRQLVSDKVSSVACGTTAGAGQLYVGYASDGVTIHDIESGQRDQIDRSSGLPTTAVEQILLVDEVVWINTGSSLLFFDQVSGDTQVFSKAEETLPTQNISEMVWDSTGTGLVWMATNDGLMSGNSQGEFTLYTAENNNLPEGLGESVTIALNGLVWYGGSFGDICAFNPVTSSCDMTHYHPPGEFQVDGAITALDVSAGALVYGHRRDGVRVGTFAQQSDSSSPIKVATWQSLIVPNQFPVNKITALAEADGLIWVGTRDGVYTTPVEDVSGENWRFFDIQNSPLPSNWITELFPDPNGGMWIGTFRGAVYFGTVWPQKPIMPEQHIQSIVRDQLENNIWIGTSRGLFQYDGRSVVEMRDLPTINVSTLKWVQDDLYIGLEDGRIGVLTGGVFDIFDSSNSPLSPDPVAVIEDGPDGTFYIGNGENLYVLNTARTFERFPNIYGYYISDIIYQDQSAEVLVATTSNSLFYYDTFDWQQITVRDGLPTGQVVEMLLDSRGTVWLAGQSSSDDGGGLARYIPYPAGELAEQ